MNLDITHFLTLINTCILIFSIIVIFYYFVGSNKLFKHIYKEIKYEFMYNLIGMKAIFDDYITREKETGKYLVDTRKIIVITGGARGIGAAVVKKLLTYDLQIIIGCRNVAAGENLIKQIRALGIKTGEVEVLELDVSSLESVTLFSNKINEKYAKIHILINNAGKMFGPYTESKDGYESQFSTNYLGHFFLTHLLLPKLVAGGELENNSRIVNVSSIAHFLGSINFEDINMKNEYISKAAYAQSKLGQILFTLHLNNVMKVRNLPVSAYCIHPGMVNTDLFNDTLLKKVMGSRLLNLCFKTPEQGARSIIYASLSPQLECFGGTYISNSKITCTSEMTYSVDLQKKFFEYTNNLLSISEFGKSIKTI